MLMNPDSVAGECRQKVRLRDWLVPGMLMNPDSVAGEPRLGPAPFAVWQKRPTSAMYRHQRYER
jgi:hypothetical protein